jgi:cephalosporin hydroxylase
MLMITIDMENSCLYIGDGAEKKKIQLSDPQAFEILSEIWLRSGWDNKYVYTFSWFGRPIIQLPEDMIRIQEMIYSIKPDVIIETGVAHGGSLIYYSSLCKAMGKGRVIGVDIEIRPHNRQAIEVHPLFSYITLFEGSSTDTDVVGKVKNEILSGDTVLILLDSNHTKDHVLSELKAYSSLVTVGSYIVAMDGIMEKVTGAPRTQPDWIWNNPQQAAFEFVKGNPDFEIVEPPFVFNESSLSNKVTYWPSGYIKRIR